MYESVDECSCRTVTCRLTPSEVRHTSGDPPRAQGRSISLTPGPRSWHHISTMVYWPSSRIMDRMKIDPGGVWLDRSSSPAELWMVAKLPMHVIRAVNVGAAVSLRAWVVEIEGKHVAAYGLQVHDDPQKPFNTFGPCESEDEIEHLRAIITGAAFPLQFHNETFEPVFQADCVLVPEFARALLDSLPSSAANNRELMRRALDVVEGSLEDGGTDNQRMIVHCVLPIRFERSRPIDVFVIGSGLFSVDDKHEGNELERLAFNAFEFLCPWGSYHQPLVEEGGKRRELCDILAVSRIREDDEEGLFVVQSKVASVTQEALARSTERRAASIQKNIITAIRQLKGAIKRLRAGAPIFRADGTPIEMVPLPPELAGMIEPLQLHERANKVGHGIVLVSEMHDGVDWGEVASQLIDASKSTEYFLHVLDLRELQQLISNSNQRASQLYAYLAIRWEQMVKEKNAFWRSHFVR